MKLNDDLQKLNLLTVLNLNNSKQKQTKDNNNFPNDKYLTH